MAKPGAGQRPAWKERIDQSSWVDNTGWLDDDRKPVDEPVEFLEAEPSAYRISETVKEESAGVFASPSARLIGLGAVAVVLLALALMSRPGDQDPFEQLPADRQQQILQRQNDRAAQADAADPVDDRADSPVEEGEPQRSTDTSLPQPVPTPSRGGTLGDGTDGTDGEPLTLAAIPPLRDDLSPELPDVLYAYGAAGSVITITRGVDQPQEFIVPFQPDVGSMLYSETDGVPLVLAGGALLAVLPDGGSESTPVEADAMLPSDDGIMLVTDGRQGREVIISGLLDRGGDAFDVGYDLELLGAWRDQAVVHKAGRIWLRDDGGNFQPVTDGVLIAYDGRNLAMVRCDTPDDCRIEVGPPDNPDLRSVPVPRDFLGRPIESWTGSSAISPDGTRLAMLDQRVLALPNWIDLDTGEHIGRSDSANSQSPVMWSPDGRWLAYVSSENIVVWDTEADQSWSIFVDRPISDLAWGSGVPS